MREGFAEALSPAAARAHGDHHLQIHRATYEANASFASTTMRGLTAGQAVLIQYWSGIYGCA